MENFAKILGKNIKVFRVIRDMSQADLALAAELTQSYLSKVESGTVNITVLKLHYLALAMNCSLAELLPTEYNSLDINNGPF